MGFFSQDCHGCKHPILSTYVINPVNAWMNTAVAATVRGEVLIGSYDGYGRLDDHEGAVGFDNTVWHLACWEVAGKPYEYRGPSDQSDDQGFFYEDPAHDMPDPRTANPRPAWRVVVERTELIEFEVHADDEDAALADFLQGDEVTSDTVRLHVTEVRQVKS